MKHKFKNITTRAVTVRSASRAAELDDLLLLSRDEGALVGADVGLRYGARIQSAYDKLVAEIDFVVTTYTQLTNKNISPGVGIPLLREALRDSKDQLLGRSDDFIRAVRNYEAEIKPIIPRPGGYEAIAAPFGKLVGDLKRALDVFHDQGDLSGLASFVEKHGTAQLRFLSESMSLAEVVKPGRKPGPTPVVDYILKAIRTIEGTAGEQYERLTKQLEDRSDVQQWNADVKKSKETPPDKRKADTTPALAGRSLEVSVYARLGCGELDRVQGGEIIRQMKRDHPGY